MSSQPSQSPAEHTPPADSSILIVEDELGIAETLGDILTDEGYRVATAVDGVALGMALADPPALVLLDVMMPGMDGLEVYRRLRADPRTRRVPVVFITVVPPERLAAWLGNGRDATILPKPFRLGQVLAAVEGHLGPGPAARR